MHPSEESHHINLSVKAQFKMVDVGEKLATRRRAVASGIFRAQPSTLQTIVSRRLPKGDALILAEVAAIQGAKSASSHIPLCHPLTLDSVRAWTQIFPDQLAFFCEVRCHGKTGVEMEALAGVSAGLLCIYDLTKMVDSHLEISNMQLDLKEGGKTGLWINPHSRLSENVERPPESGELLRDLRCAVMTVSDRCSQGLATDQSGPAAIEFFNSHGGKCVSHAVVPDESRLIQAQVGDWLEHRTADVIITTGGTGLGPRDVTPETLRNLAQQASGREIEGLGELLRQKGLEKTPFSVLSRSLALQIRGTVVIALPGNPKAVMEGLEVVAPLLRHVVDISHGGRH